MDTTPKSFSERLQEWMAHSEQNAFRIKAVDPDNAMEILEGFHRDRPRQVVIDEHNARNKAFLEWVDNLPAEEYKQLKEDVERAVISEWQSNNQSKP